MKKLISILLCFQFVLITPAMAQDEGAAEPAADDFLKNTQQDAIIVAGAAVGGAIIGLSTLSFVDKPSKHVANIWTGAAVGLIVGVIFVAYSSAQKGQEELLEEEEASIDFDSNDRLRWHSENNNLYTFQAKAFETPLWQKTF